MFGDGSTVPRAGRRRSSYIPNRTGEMRIALSSEALEEEVEVAAHH